MVVAADTVEMDPQGLDRVEALFQEQIEQGTHPGSALAVYRHGKPVLDLFGGAADAEALKSAAYDSGTVEEARAALIAGCAATQLTNQGVFLERLGITPRAQSLAKGLAGDALDAHVAAHRRLTHPDEMGSLFKVLGLYPVNESPPPGLDP